MGSLAGREKGPCRERQGTDLNSAPRPGAPLDCVSALPPSPVCCGRDAASRKLVHPLAVRRPGEGCGRIGSDMHRRCLGQYAMHRTGRPQAESGRPSTSESRSTGGDTPVRAFSRRWCMWSHPDHAYLRGPTCHLLWTNTQVRRKSRRWSGWCLMAMVSVQCTLEGDPCSSRPVSPKCISACR